MDYVLVVFAGCAENCYENFFLTVGSLVVYYLLIFRMIQTLRSEATRSEDMFAQLQETQESVRLAFLNCILDFAGMMDE